MIIVHLSSLEWEVLRHLVRELPQSRERTRFLEGPRRGEVWVTPARELLLSAALKVPYVPFLDQMREANRISQSMHRRRREALSSLTSKLENATKH